MNRRIKAIFYISGGDWDPSTCTAALALEPTETRRRGAVSRPQGPPAPENEWALESDWVDVASTDEPVAHLLDRLWPVRSAVRRFVDANAASCGVVVVVEILTERPVFELTKQSLTRLADLSAAFSFDIYDLREGQTLSQ
jgi:hypothetical protein